MTQLEKLQIRIYRWVPTAFGAEVEWDDWLEFEQDMGGQTKNLLPARRGEYKLASVRFKLQELTGLKPAEFSILQQSLELVIKDEYSHQKKVIPTETQKFIEPGSAFNILGHEEDHGTAYPEKFHSQVFIDLGLCRPTNRERLHLIGSTWCLNNEVTSKERAVVASAPKILSTQDLANVYYYLEEIDDTEFRDFIGHRVSIREVY